MKTVLKALLPQSVIGHLVSIRTFPAYLGRTVRPDTPFWVSFFYQAVKFLHYGDYLKRRRLALELRKHTDLRIDPDKAYLLADTRDDPDAKACLEHCLALADEIDFEAQRKKAQKDFLITYHIDCQLPEHEAIRKFALSPRILGAVADYIGTMPVMLSSSIWYSNSDNFEGRSQLYHMDGDDRRTVRLMFLLDDIDSDARPFTLIPARETETLFKKLRKMGIVRRRNQKLDDDTVYGNSTIKKGVELTGEKGMVAMADPVRCYHFGSRQGKKRRLLMMLHYQSAYTTELPVWGRRENQIKVVANDPAETRELAQLAMGMSHQNFHTVRSLHQKSLGKTVIDAY